MKGVDDCYSVKTNEDQVHLSPNHSTLVEKLFKMTQKAESGLLVKCYDSMDEVLQPIPVN